MKLSLGPYSGSREDANATWSTSKWTGAFKSGREMYEVSHLWYRSHYCMRRQLTASWPPFIKPSPLIIWSAP